PVHAGDVDDAAPAAGVHVRERAAGQPERRLQHHAQEQREPVGVELGDRRDVLQSRVVDQDVDVAGQRVDGGEVGQVAGHRFDARVPCELGRPGLVAVDGQNLGSYGAATDI